MKRNLLIDGTLFLGAPMKVKLSVGEHPLNGYINIDPVCQNVDRLPNVINVDVRGACEYLEDASVTELICSNIFDYLASSEVFSTLQSLVKKLRHKAKIVITSTDLELACKQYLNGLLNTIEFNQIIHGQQDKPWNYKRGQVTMDELCEMLRELGILVITKNYESDCFFTITGQRP